MCAFSFFMEVDGSLCNSIIGNILFKRLDLESFASRLL